MPIRFLDEQQSGKITFTEPEMVESGFAGLPQQMREREAQAQDINKMYQQGITSAPEYAYQMAGKVGAGAVGDVAGAALSEAARGAKFIDELTGGYGSEALGGAASAIGAIPTYTGQTIGETVPQELSNLYNKYNEWAKSNPRSAMNIESGANFLGLGVPVMKRGENILDNTVNLTKSLTKKDINSFNSDELREIAGNLYQKADNIGGKVKPEFWDEYLRKVSRNIDRPEGAAQALEGVSGNKTLNKAIEALSSVQGDTQSFKALKKTDEILGDLANSAVNPQGKYTNEGRQFLMMQQELRNMVENAGEDLFVGGREAFDVAKEARKIWAASNRMSDVEAIIQKSIGAAQPSTVLKNGFRRLRDNKKKFKSFSPEEQFAIKKAAETGKAEAFLKLQASGLGPVIAGGAGFALGGPAGAAAAVPSYMLREGAKMTVEGMKGAQANKVLQQIGATATGQAPVYSSPYAYGLARDIGMSTAPIGAAQAAQQETLSQRAKRLLNERQ